MLWCACTQMEVFEVEKRGFYVRVVSNKGRGIAALLYKALESLTTFTLATSNLAASAHNYVFTFTLHVSKHSSFLYIIRYLPNTSRYVQNSI